MPPEDTLYSVVADVYGPDSRVEYVIAGVGLDYDVAVILAERCANMGVWEGDREFYPAHTVRRVRLIREA